MTTRAMTIQDVIGLAVSDKKFARKLGARIQGNDVLDAEVTAGWETLLRDSAGTVLELTRVRAATPLAKVKYPTLKTLTTTLTTWTFTLTTMACTFTTATTVTTLTTTTTTTGPE